MNFLPIPILESFVSQNRPISQAFFRKAMQNRYRIDQTFSSHERVSADSMRLMNEKPRIMILPH